MTITYYNTNVLSEKERAVFEGYHKNDKSFIDIATSLGISHADAVERYIDAVQTLEQQEEIKKEKVAKKLATIVDIIDLHGRNQISPILHDRVFDTFPSEYSPFEIANYMHETRFTATELIDYIPALSGRVYEQVKLTTFIQKRKEWEHEYDFSLPASPHLLHQRIEEWIKTPEGKQHMQSLQDQYQSRLRKEITVEHVLEKAKQI